MPVEVILPKVDMDMATGKIAKWHVKEGDAVKKGALLFEIETDKAAMEIDAPGDGIIRNITAPKGPSCRSGRRWPSFIRTAKRSAPIAAQPLAPVQPIAPAPRPDAELNRLAPCSIRIWTVFLQRRLPGGWHGQGRNCP